VSSIELDFEGEVAEHDANLLVASAIKGVLQPFTEDRINTVNARLYRFEPRREASRTPKPGPRQLREPGHRSHGRPRARGHRTQRRASAVRIDSFPRRPRAEGRFLVSRHEDRPGVVGRFGTILGEHDVNIASMQVGRDAPRGNAMMILAVDDRVADDVLGRLREVAGMSDLKYVELGGDSNR